MDPTRHPRAKKRLRGLGLAFLLLSPLRGPHATSTRQKTPAWKIRQSSLLILLVLKLLMYEKMVLATHTIRAPALNC